MKELSDNENSLDNPYYEGINSNIDETGILVSPFYYENSDVISNLSDPVYLFYDNIKLLELNYRNLTSEEDPPVDVSELTVKQYSSCKQKVTNLIWDMFDAFDAFDYHDVSSSLVYQETDDDGGFNPYSDWTNKIDNYNFTSETLIEGFRTSNDVFDFISFIGSHITDSIEEIEFYNFVTEYYGLAKRISANQAYFDNRDIIDIGSPIEISNDTSVIIENKDIKFENLGVLEVNGTLTIGDNVTLTAENSQGKILVNGTLNIGNNVFFDNVEISHDNTEFSINNCRFNNSTIKSYKIADSNITHCQFFDSQLIFDSCEKILIEENYFSVEKNNHKQVRLLYSGFKGQIMISNNIFENCSPAIDAFNSNYIVENNQVTHGNTAILATHKSVGEVIGSNQTFENQTDHPFIFQCDSVPVKFEYNKFINHTNLTNPYIVCVQHNGHIHDIPNNYWDVSNLHFEPQSAFNITPVWNGRELRDDEDYLLYSESCEQLYNEDFQNANLGFIDIIENYQDSEFAIASLHRIMEITAQTDNNYYSLQNFYNSIDVSSDNPAFIDEVGYLENYCNLFLNNFSEAIDFFENSIDNAETTQDSINAVIDLAYTYLQLEDYSDGRDDRIPSIYPKSREEFYSFSENLRESNILLEGDEENSNTTPTLFKATNFPNPFNPTTTISYALPQNGQTEITIFNLKGQKVKTLVNQEMEAGNYQVQWNGTDEAAKKVSSGVYFYKLDLNGKTKAVNKCLMLK